VISNEEYNQGLIWQVDPTGQKVAFPISMGKDIPGLYESFAYDVRNKGRPRFFATEDLDLGALRRWTPSAPNWKDPWNILYGVGTTAYLELLPDAASANAGTFRWTTNLTAGRDNAKKMFPNTEGIFVYQSDLFFLSKVYKSLFILNLDARTYRNETTRHGLFDGQPDQMQRVDGADANNLLYFTEDGGKDAGIHARNSLGQYFTILESPVYIEETTGLAFSPDGKYMYVAYQKSGYVFEIRREDGQTFLQLPLRTQL
jgi:hypothetical protein